jgi:F-type H+-transporting ATPase subunit c
MNLVKKIGVCLSLLMLVCFAANSAFAQGQPAPAGTTVTSNAVPMGGAAMGAGVGAGLVIIGAAYGFGKIGAAALESMARQPETAGRVQTAMIIIGALLEGATFFALIVCIQLAGRA